MTSEEMGFGEDVAPTRTIARLVGVTFLVCALFVVAMYFVGHGNTRSPAAKAQTTVTVPLK